MAPTLKHISATIAATGLGVLLGAGIERRSPVLEIQEVPLLKPGTPQIRILHISDLHMTFQQNWLVSFLHSLADLNPDLVISTGDNFDTGDGLGSLLEAYEPLLNFPGAFTFGSNDYFSGKLKSPTRYLYNFSKDTRVKTDLPDLPFSALRTALQRGGWFDLNNATAEINLNPLSTSNDSSQIAPSINTTTTTSIDHAGTNTSNIETTTQVSLIGVDDPHPGLDALPAPNPQWDTASLRLGVTHAPYQRVLTSMHELGADLILAGHTHGGQLCLPGIGALITNCDLDRHYASGLFKWPLESTSEAIPLNDFEDAAKNQTSTLAAETWVHVSRGLGTNRWTPVRSFCRPEATLLVLQPKSSV